MNGATCTKYEGPYIDKYFEQTKCTEIIVMKKVESLECLKMVQTLNVSIECIMKSLRKTYKRIISLGNKQFCGITFKRILELRLSLNYFHCLTVSTKTDILNYAKDSIANDSISDEVLTTILIEKFDFLLVGAMLDQEDHRVACLGRKDMVKKLEFPLKIHDITVNESLLTYIQCTPMKATQKDETVNNLHIEFEHVIQEIERKTSCFKEYAKNVIYLHDSEMESQTKATEDFTQKNLSLLNVLEKIKSILIDLEDQVDKFKSSTSELLEYGKDVFSTFHIELVSFYHIVKSLDRGRLIRQIGLQAKIEGVHKTSTYFHEFLDMFHRSLKVHLSVRTIKNKINPKKNNIEDIFYQNNVLLQMKHGKDFCELETFVKDPFSLDPNYVAYKMTHFYYRAVEEIESAISTFKVLRDTACDVFGTLPYTKPQFQPLKPNVISKIYKTFLTIFESLEDTLTILHVVTILEEVDLKGGLAILGLNIARYDFSVIHHVFHSLGHIGSKLGNYSNSFNEDALEGFVHLHNAMMILQKITVPTQKIKELCTDGAIKNSFQCLLENAKVSLKGPANHYFADEAVAGLPKIDFLHGCVSTFGKLNEKDGKLSCMIHRLKFLFKLLDGFMPFIEYFGNGLMTEVIKNGVCEENEKTRSRTSNIFYKNLKCASDLLDKLCIDFIRLKKLIRNSHAWFEIFTKCKLSPHAFEAFDQMQDSDEYLVIVDSEALPKTMDFCCHLVNKIIYHILLMDEKVVFYLQKKLMFRISKLNNFLREIKSVVDDLFSSLDGFLDMDCIKNADRFDVFGLYTTEFNNVRTHDIRERYIDEPSRFTLDVVSAENIVRNKINKILITVALTLRNQSYRIIDANEFLDHEYSLREMISNLLEMELSRVSFFFNQTNVLVQKLYELFIVWKSSREDHVVWKIVEKMCNSEDFLYSIHQFVRVELGTIVRQLECLSQLMEDEDEIILLEHCQVFCDYSLGNLQFCLTELSFDMLDMIEIMKRYSTCSRERIIHKALSTSFKNSNEFLKQQNIPVTNKSDTQLPSNVKFTLNKMPESIKLKSPLKNKPSFTLSDLVADIIEETFNKKGDCNENKDCVPRNKMDNNSAINESCPQKENGSSSIQSLLRDTENKTGTPRKSCKRRLSPTSYLDNQKECKKMVPNAAEDGQTKVTEKDTLRQMRLKDNRAVFKAILKPDSTATPSDRQTDLFIKNERQTKAFLEDDSLEIDVGCMVDLSKSLSPSTTPIPQDKYSAYERTFCKNLNRSKGENVVSLTGEMEQPAQKIKSFIDGATATTNVNMSDDIRSEMPNLLSLLEPKTEDKNSGNLVVDEMKDQTYRKTANKYRNLDENKALLWLTASNGKLSLVILKMKSLVQMMIDAKIVIYKLYYQIYLDKKSSDVLPIKVASLDGVRRISDWDCFFKGMSRQMDSMTMQFLFKSKAHKKIYDGFVDHLKSLSTLLAEKSDLICQVPFFGFNSFVKDYYRSFYRSTSELESELKNLERVLDDYLGYLASGIVF